MDSDSDGGAERGSFCAADRLDRLIALSASEHVIAKFNLIFKLPGGENFFFHNFSSVCVRLAGFFIIHRRKQTSFRMRFFVQRKQGSFEKTRRYSF